MTSTPSTLVVATTCVVAAPIASPVLLTVSPSPTAPPAASAPAPGTVAIAAVATTQAPASPTNFQTTSAGQDSSADGALVALLGVILAALIVMGWNIWLARRKSREDERNRQRNSFATAFKAYGQYKEFPYAIRRRRHDAASEERSRLSESLREIQADLTYHQVWMDLENKDVAAKYRDLIGEVRTLAGDLMQAAWRAEPITEDQQMNIGTDLVDLRSLADAEKSYLDAVQQHLYTLAPWWCR